MIPLIGFIVAVFAGAVLMILPTMGMRLKGDAVLTYRWLITALAIIGIGILCLKLYEQAQDAEKAMRSGYVPTLYQR